jgi:hypothetical protein
VTLNVLKWVYDLGVRNERERIAGYLQSIQAQHGVGIYGRPQMLIPNEDELAKAKRREFQAAVSAEVSYIIEDIFRTHDVPGPSIMHPNK